MPNRIIKESICTSESIDALSVEGERFFYRLVVQADDYGWTLADPRVLRARCFPLCTDDITEEAVCAWLRELVFAEILSIWEYSGKKYVHFDQWDNHQNRRARNSKFPVEGNLDNARKMNADEIICKQPYTDASNRMHMSPRNRGIEESRNRSSSCSSDEPDERKITKKKKDVYPPEFLKFWEAYPRKVSKGQAVKAWHQTSGLRPPIADLVAHLEKRKKSPDWTRDGGEFIPYPATWLRASGWEDEIKVGVTPPADYDWKNPYHEADYRKVMASKNPEILEAWDKYKEHQESTIGWSGANAWPRFKPEEWCDEL